jgi:hypothetical protein
LNADRNIGFSATVSARALKVAAFISFSGLLHQDGTRPPSHRHELVIDHGVHRVGRTDVERGCRFAAGDVSEYIACICVQV